MRRQLRRVWAFTVDFCLDWVDMLWRCRVCGSWRHETGDHPA